MKLIKVCAATLFATCLVTGCKSNSTAEMNGIANFGKNQNLRLPLSEKGLMLDPRFAATVGCKNVARMLFEGLTYVDENGKIFPGCAEKIHTSDDLKTYTFILRDAKWSNGDQLKAQDFEYTWLSELNPELKAPSAYMLFAIEGAQSFYEGKASRDKVGIHVVDDKTLVVTLESPCPYFLQLTATSAYLPVNPKHADFTNEFVTNGPFSVSNYTPDQKLDLVKSKTYWSSAAVKLDKAEISLLDDDAALQAFLNGDLDWVGSPVTTLGQAGRESVKAVNKLHFAPVAGTQFLRLNTTKAPFGNANFRKALMMAIDTKALCDNIMKGEQMPAASFVPPNMGITSNPTNYDPKQAAKLFEEALVEQFITRNDLPKITFSYIQSDRMQQLAEACVQNWKSVCNIDVALEPVEAAAFYDKLFAQDYTVASGSWFADYYDPMSFLSVFEYKDNGTNYTGWENTNYIKLLNDSNNSLDATKRYELLGQAQDVLMQEMPILPLFHFTFSSGKSDRLEQGNLSPLGMIDVEDAYFVQAK